jgi:hypothetical protein
MGRMNCCKPDTTTFLEEKAENFRVFLLGQNPDSTLLESIQGFEKSNLTNTLYTVFLPGVALKGIESLTDELMTHLTPTDAVAVRTKVSRYLTCFHEVLTSL